MQSSLLSRLGAGSAMCLTCVALGASQPASTRTTDGIERIDRSAKPVGLHHHNGRVTRIVGPELATGPTGRAAAEQFRVERAALLGIPADELVADDPALGGRPSQPLMFNRNTGEFKFTAYTFRQKRGNVPVFRSKMIVLSRNQADHAIVHASANVRALGDLQVDRADALRRLDEDRLQRIADANLGEGSTRSTPRLVIWAGTDTEPADEARLAWETTVSNDAERWLLLNDVYTGETLYKEDLICKVNVSGNVSGFATTGAGAEDCEPEELLPLPYLEVTADGVSTFTDVNGNYSLETPGGGGVGATVSGELKGQWFDVINFVGSDEFESTPIAPTDADLTFNSANNDELVRAQVNGYVYSNLIRDWVLVQNPTYPTLQNTGFPVRVNRTDGFCPGNAWYDPTD